MNDAVHCVGVAPGCSAPMIVVLPKIREIPLAIVKSVLSPVIVIVTDALCCISAGETLRIRTGGAAKTRCTADQGLCTAPLRARTRQ